MSHALSLPIVCVNKKRCNITSNMANEMGMVIPKPITAIDMAYHPGLYERQGVLVDDMQEIVEVMLRCRIECAALTGKAIILDGFPGGQA